MKQVPYHANPGNACALACYAMVAQYLLPEEGITFEQLAKIASWQKGYVVWGFLAWKWLMDNGVHITDYDTIDYQAWAQQGTEGLRESTPPKEFEYYQANTFDLEEEGRRATLALNHPNFSYVQRTPSWQDVVAECKKPGICDITLNRHKLNGQQGFDGHRVVIIEITDSEVVFHDPNREGTGAYRKEPIELFRAAVEDFGAFELARYSCA